MGRERGSHCADPGRGSKRHGGPDLGPTRAKRAWQSLGVNGKTLAEKPPAQGYKGVPRLTVQMAAMVQGFPADWAITGRKTNAYRQLGNAFPPPAAAALGRAVRSALEADRGSIGAGRQLRLSAVN